jgi:hypothetical protein
VSVKFDGHLGRLDLAGKARCGAAQLGRQPGAPAAPPPTTPPSARRRRRHSHVEAV